MSESLRDTVFAGDFIKIFIKVEEDDQGRKEKNPDEEFRDQNR